MSYITISDYLSFAWLTTLDSATSTRVSSLIDVTKEILDDVIGDLTYWLKTEDIRVCDITEEWVIQFSNLYIESINEVNGLSYTWVLNTDYQIQPPKDSCVCFLNISTYLSSLRFAYFPIDYISWCSTIPEDIKYLQYLMVEWELNKSWWKEVKSYSLWPRSVTFADDEKANSAQKIINNYYIPYV